MSKKKRRVDSEDLNCTTCLQLVVNATQTPCCGILFCRTCIVTWTDVNSSCPCCRKNLNSAKLVTDVRSERKSSAKLRNCKNSGCDFSGGRSDMTQHETVCVHPLEPELLRAKVRDLTLALGQAKQEIAHLTEEKTLEITRRKTEVTAAAWQKKEEILRKMNGLGVVVMLKKETRTSEVYKLNFVNPVTKTAYFVQLKVANYNVSAMLYCKESPVKEKHNYTVSVTLIHPNGPQFNKVSKLHASFNKGENCGYGNRNWMNDTEFRTFFKDDMIAIGV